MRGQFHGPADNEGDEDRGTEHGQVLLNAQQYRQRPLGFTANRINNPMLLFLCAFFTHSLLTSLFVCPLVGMVKMNKYQPPSTEFECAQENRFKFG
jgi:hypothetical protein